MALWLKGTALGLAIIFICTLGLGGSAPAAVPETTDTPYENWGAIDWD